VAVEKAPERAAAGSNPTLAQLCKRLDATDDNRLHQSDWVTNRVAWAMRLAIVVVARFFLISPRTRRAHAAF
jgi:hypothetical protein